MKRALDASIAENRRRTNGTRRPDKRRVQPCQGRTGGAEVTPHEPVITYSQLSCEFLQVDDLEDEIAKLASVQGSPFVLLRNVSIDRLHTPESIGELRDHLNFGQYVGDGSNTQYFYANAALSESASNVFRRERENAKADMSRVSFWLWLLEASLAQRVGTVDLTLGFEWVLGCRQKHVNKKYPERYEIIYAKTPTRQNRHPIGRIFDELKNSSREYEDKDLKDVADAIGTLSPEQKKEVRAVLEKADRIPGILYFIHCLEWVSDSSDWKDDVLSYAVASLGDYAKTEVRPAMEEVENAIKADRRGRTLSAIGSMVQHLPRFCGDAFPDMVRLYAQQTMQNMTATDALHLARAVRTAREEGRVDVGASIKAVAPLFVPWVSPVGEASNGVAQGLGRDVLSRAAVYDIPMRRLYRTSGSDTPDVMRKAIAIPVAIRDAMVQSHSVGNAYTTYGGIVKNYIDLASQRVPRDVTQPVRATHDIRITAECGAARHAGMIVRKTVNNNCPCRLDGEWIRPFVDAGFLSVEDVDVRPRGSGFARTERRVYIPAMHNMIREVTNAIKLVTSRWNRSVDADGCRTYEDVVARVNNKKTPQHHLNTSAPRWDNRDFQQRWVRLDAYQKRAVARAVLYPVSFILGPPGAGKTHVIECIFALHGNASTALSAYGIVSKMLRGRVTSSHTCHRAESIVRAQIARELSEGNDGATADDPFAKLLLSCPTLVFDELSLLNVEHLMRAFNRGVVDTKRRLVFAGDPYQLPAIGAGSICKSIVEKFGAPSLDLEFRSVNHYCTSTLCYPHRFIDSDTRKEILKGGRASATHRVGVGMSGENNMKRPRDATDPMAVPYNMNELLNYQHVSVWRGREARPTIDLVYSELPRHYKYAAGSLGNDIGRFVVGPLRSRDPRDMPEYYRWMSEYRYAKATREDPDNLYNTGNVCMCIDDALKLVDANLSINHPDVQVLTHTNRLRRSINRVQLERGWSTIENIRPGSKITFNKNKYFIHNKGGDDAGKKKRGNVAVEDVALDAQGHMSSNQATGTRRDVEACLGEQNERQEFLEKERTKRDSKYRGTICEDAFNGDIRIVDAIYVYNVEDGRVVAKTRPTYDTVGNAIVDVYEYGRRMGLPSDKNPYDVMMSFTDGSQISLSAYEKSNIDFGSCVTGTKFPGSQKRYIVYVHRPSPHIDNAYIYTLMTRAEHTFIFLSGKDPAAARKNLGEAVTRVNQPPVEDFAERIEIGQLKM